MNLIKLTKTYYKFRKEELLNMLFIIVAAGFMLSFRDWGAETFDVKSGLFNFFNAMLICALAIFVHESAHKIAAYSRGYDAEHKAWYAGTLFGGLLTLFANGYAFFFGFGIQIYHLAAERLGKFRHYFSLKDLGFISAMGPLSNIALAIFFKLFYSINPTALIHKAMMINIWFAIFNILPLPWLDGGNVFFASRIKYTFFIALIFSFSVTLYFVPSVIGTIIMSVLFAIAMMIWWAVYFEGVVDK